MITQLVETLQQTGLDLTGREIAETLFLALHNVTPLHRLPPVTAPPEAPATEVTSPATTGSTLTPAAHDPESVQNKPSQPGQGDLFVPAANSSNAGPGVSAVPFRVASAMALPGAQEIARALRPLLRRHPSRTRREIDVDRTVQQIADGGPVAIVECPARERWLDVALVVDESASMRVWRPTVREFQRLLERHGAFRDVSVWGMYADDGEARFYRETGMAAPPVRSADPRELLDPNGRRLVMIVSDCIGQGWHTGAAFQLLTEWSRSGPAVLLQVLPQRMWRGTALPPVSVSLQAATPACANSRLEVSRVRRSRKPLPAGLPIPVVIAEGWAIAPWAQMVAARGLATAAGLIIPNAPLPAVAGNEADDDEPDDLPGGQQEDNAQAQVERFKRTASPPAFQLACYLAAVELNLPVMRLVQQAMLPDSRQIHLAEVFLSGLLIQKTEAEKSLTPDEILYDFLPGVREELLRRMPATETRRVVTEVWRLIEQRQPYAADFRVLMARPGEQSDQKVAVGRRAFATISPDALARLGFNRSPVTSAAATSSQTPVPGSAQFRLSPQVLYDAMTGYLAEEFNARLPSELVALLPGEVLKLASEAGIFVSDDTLMVSPQPERYGPNLKIAGELGELLIQIYLRHREQQEKNEEQPVPPDLQNLTGALIEERYIIERLIWKGHLGTDVYLAQDRARFGRQFTLKVLNLSGLNEQMKAWAERQFEEEIRILSRLPKYPAVVGLMAQGRLPGGQRYLLLTDAPGDTLRTLMERDKLSLERIAVIVQQVADALEFLHRQGVVYYNLKPDNIGLQVTGQGEGIVLRDFGLAADVTSPQPDSATRLSAGTPPYMAPEQIEGAVSFSCDIYALGVVAYELVTGQRPIPDQGNLVQYFALQKKEALISPGRLRSDLPPAAERVLLKCLSFRPEDRYQQAQEFGHDFTKAISVGRPSRKSGTEPAEDPAELMQQAAADLNRDCTKRRARSFSALWPCAASFRIAAARFWRSTTWAKLTFSPDIQRRPAAITAKRCGWLVKSVIVPKPP